MEEILKKLDENVFTPEIVSAIKEAHEAAVKKVSESLEQTILAKDMEIAEIKVMAEKYVDMLKESFEEEKTEMIEAFADYEQEKDSIINESRNKELQDLVEVNENINSEVIDSLVESIDRYIDIAVNEYIEDNKMAMVESTKQFKLDALLEGFDSLLRTAGTTLSDISESKTPSDDDLNDIESLNKTIAKLISENRKLKEGINKSTRDSIYKKISEGLTLVESEKFSKLAEMVKFEPEDSVNFEKRLVYIKSQIIGTEEEPAVVESIINESTKTSKSTKVDYSRYI